jgi:peroxiredoxin
MKIPESPELVTPLLIGASIPDVNVFTVDGRMFNIKHEIQQTPSVIIFYRGGWCPFCNTQLGGLKEVETDIIKLGYQIFAISPDKVESLRETGEKHSLNVTLLSDSDMKLTQAFGVAYKLDDAMVDRYKSFHMDLEGSSGMGHHLLPVPSVFITNSEGNIDFNYVNPDYKIRLNSEVLLTILQSLKKK